MTAATGRPPLSAVPFQGSDRTHGARTRATFPGPFELDGAWWLRSQNLRRQLTPLAVGLDPLWGRIPLLCGTSDYWSLLLVPSALGARMTR
jgi:hypothetical protein